MTQSDAGSNVYLNFEHHAYELQSQLADLRRRHGKDPLPNRPADGNILDHFVRVAFPEGLRANYFVCNTSLKEGQQYINIRLKVDGPRLEKELPRGVTLCIRGRVPLATRPEGVLFVDEISDTSDVPRKDFEAEISARPYTSKEKVYHAPRAQSVLNPGFLDALPPISLTTRSKLVEWRDFLTWKRRVVENKTAGLRYLCVALRGDLLSFTVACENRESFEAYRRQFNNEDLKVFDLDYSTDPWIFTYNEKWQKEPVAIGDFKAAVPLDAPVSGPEETPWEHSFFAELRFALCDDDKDEISGLSEDEVESARRHLLGKYPKTGFLAISSAGDFALISRMERVFQKFEEQSGYNPYLSSHLFDIGNAAVPQVSSEITRWYSPSLDRDQKDAVQKMIDAPDIGLIQGPPGTGKTTVIAEALAQFATRDLKTLVASQAHLAVDNAIEKLPLNPAIRPLRLGPEMKITRYGKPFIRERVLGRYYGSVASECRQRHLGPAEDLRLRVDAATRWLDPAALIHDDIERFGTLHQGIRLQHEAAQERRGQEMLRHQQIRDLNEANQMMSRHLQTFIGFLDRSLEGDFLLPESILATAYREMVEPLGALEELHIRVNPHWRAQDGFSTGERSAFLRNILARWDEVAASLPALKADLELLRNLAGDKIMPPTVLAEIEQLGRLIEDVERRMVDERSLLDEWQRLQQRKRELSRKSTGLERDVYARVFNGLSHGKPFHETLVRGELGKAAAVELLTAAVERIERLAPSLKAARARLVKQVDVLLRDLRPVGIDEKPLCHMEAELRALAWQAQQLEESRRSKERELEAHISRLRKDSLLGKACPAGGYDEIREALRQRVEQDRAALDKGGEFLALWEPFLREWVGDLENPEKVKTDHPHFIDTYTANCNVIGVTCTENPWTLIKAGHSHFDVAIIDEVSKATPPELLIAMMSARKTLLVGDHRQLPPVFQERPWEAVIEEGAEEGDQDPLLTRANFDRHQRMVTASLFKALFESAPDALKASLLTQYRMHPDIMEVINHFYEYKLKCGLENPDVERNHGLTLLSPDGLEFITPDRHAVWVDSSREPDGRPHYERQKGSSKVNTLEAALILETLTRINEECRKQGYGHAKKKEVGVISFYGQQVRLLRRIIQNCERATIHRLDALDVDVNTVSQFQGKEKPIILVSLARHSRNARKSARSFVAQFELINVAFSRARELLMIFGAKDMFYDYPVQLPFLTKPGREEKYVYRDILDGLNRKGCLWGSPRVMTMDVFRMLSSKDVLRVD